MPQQFALRLFVLRVLVLSLVVTLGARLYYLQVLDKERLVQTANRQHTREVVVAAPRGAIVDDRGRPLVTNRTSLVVSVNRSELISQSDKGKAVLRRLSALIKIPATELSRRITPCGRGVPTPCWNGSPYQPVPVVTDTTPAIVLRIAEHQEDFGGVTAEAQTLRQYPNHALAAHSLGYVGPVTQEEVDSSSATGGGTLHLDAQIGRSGLERTYDAYLRGVDGTRYVSVDNRGTVLGVQSETAPQQGDTLVTSFDRNVQAVAEKALADEIALRRTQTDKSGKNYVAASGAAVVMAPHPGRIIALASYPSYDPTVFVGGISQKELSALTSASAGTPLVSRAVDGQFAPGSTFKLSTTSAEVMSGRASLDGTYSCPGSLLVGNQQKTNYDSESIPGAIDLREALAKSCDTIFYNFAQQDWYADQARVDSHQSAQEALQKYARAFGFGSEPDVDLPSGEQSGGRIVDRAYLKKRWQANKSDYCSEAKRGYPEVTDPTRRSYLTQLAAENCTDGWRFRVGDAADLAIGQGETTVSPLQLALAYSAMVNGGTLYEPTLGRAVVSADGRVVRQITPKVRRKLPVRADILRYIQDSLAFTPQNAASGAVAFAGFPLDKVLVGGKTGTAEVYGKQDTSWLASWAPAADPKYVVVGMIEQAGLGSQAAAPMVRKIYEGIYGLDGQKAALPGGKVPSTLPALTAGRQGRSTSRAGVTSGTAKPATATATATASARPSAAAPTHGWAGDPAVPAVPPAPSSTAGPGQIRAPRRRRAAPSSPPRRRAVRPPPRQRGGGP